MEEENKTPEQAPITREASTKNFIWLYALIAIIVLGAGGLVYYKFGNTKKDSAAQTDATAETTSEKTQENSSVSDEPVYDLAQYSWSKMNEGPYNDKVSYATSSDLLHWKDSGKILATHASVPDVVSKDGTLFSYFVDVSTEGYPEKIGMVKSTDQGQTWTSREFITIKGIGQKAPADPSPILLADGRIRLFYFDIAEGRQPDAKGTQKTNKIYSAISTDGVNYTQEEDVRFEYLGIFDPDVIKVSDNLWRMYVGSMDGQEVYSATSNDGLTFQYEGVAYTGGAIPNVIFENDKYYLFTGGIDISTSTDGKVFTKTTNRFDSGKLTADPGVIKIGENNYLMVYKTGDIKPKN